MNKEFVPYEQAVSLKELGFDEPCLNRFYTKPKSKMFGIDEKGRHYPIKNTPKKLYTIGEHFILNDNNAITAPLYQQAFRWFREKYELHSFIYSDFSWNISGGIWDLDGYVDSRYDWDSEPFKTFEEAELDCLSKLIEIVKENK